MSNIPLVCDHCGKVFFDYHGSNWCDCGAKWCSETCAELDGYEKENFGSSCNYCCGDDFEDSELLEFVVSALGVSREDLVAFYKESKDQLKKGIFVNLTDALVLVLILKQEIRLLLASR